jgi:hypothetical protein
METMIPILYRIIINLNEDLFVSISFSNYYINILLQKILIKNKNKNFIQPIIHKFYLHSYLLLNKM